MLIAIGCDHGGFRLKNDICAYLAQKDIALQDFGCFDENAVDYPCIGASTATMVAQGKADYGILICSTGIGISMSANKVKGVRAALCGDTYSAEMTRRHNNANVLCMGGHMVTTQTAQRIVDVFLHTAFEGGRHQRRVDLISEIEHRGME